MVGVNAYLNFSRHTEAAFQLCRSVFGSDFKGPMHRFADIPPVPRQPPAAGADRELVTHVELPLLGGHVRMGTDAPESMGFTATPRNNVYINLEPDTRADTERLFQGLAACGQVEMPLQDMFWGAHFGSLTDRYGVRWMFNCAQKA